MVYTRMIFFSVSILDNNIGYSGGSSVNFLKFCDLNANGVWVQDD
jgi:hypothetical protein